MEVSWNRGTPSYHPFPDGIFHYKPTILGIPHLWKPPHEVFSKQPRLIHQGSPWPLPGFSHWDQRSLEGSCSCPWHLWFSSFHNRKRNEIGLSLGPKLQKHLDGLHPQNDQKCMYLRPRTMRDTDRDASFSKATFAGLDKGWGFPGKRTLDCRVLISIVSCSFYHTQ